MEMKDIVVIIPIHEFNDDIKPLLIKAIKSVPQEIEIRISCKNGLSNTLKETLTNNEELNNRDNFVLFEDSNEESKSDFATLVNQAVGDSKWFSILEFDDEYNKIWFDNVKKYIEFNSEVSMFIPLIDLIDFNNGNYIGIGNEAAWATSFSNEIGYIDHECLENYFDFYLTGSVFNTEDWNLYGGLKPSMKITFWYEYMLRLTHNNKKIYVIPKIGYKHYYNRENSLMDKYSKETDETESNWWFELAKQECFFKKDRNKTYSKK